jgi:two-component system LytT family response regulator
LAQRILWGRETYLIREALQSLVGRPDRSKFLRIHRSTIVNIDRIQKLRPLFHGDYAVKLVDGTEVVLSRKFRENLTESLGQFLS